jgi:group II intron reverse transcriptase/maturase
MTERPSSKIVSTKLQRIAQLAREAPEMAFTSLSHHIDVSFLLEAYQRTRKDGVAGVDEQTAEDYAADLEKNLQSLLDRFKSGTYWAPPVRRVHIPKGDGTKMRPIGIPTFEDKVLQRAVLMVLESVYEQDFRNCSFGFRPRRSAHQALEALRTGLMEMKGGVVLEVDIQKFFDTLDHGRLRGFLDRRVRDGVLRRTIDKWLAAGVLEEGALSYPDLGTPQGGVISPLLANVYLHEVLDVWFEDGVCSGLTGRAFLIRYADDFVIAFASEVEARRVMEVLLKRFAEFGLTLHPEKTRLVPFRRPWFGSGPKGRGGPRPGTFDLLGFTHYWARSQRGSWVIKRRTAKDRLSRALKKVSDWCRETRHHRLLDQHRGLVQKLRGHYAYFGITGNAPALKRFRYETRRIWWKWLNRRSQRARMRWERFALLLKRYPLPESVVVHSIYRRTANP